MTATRSPNRRHTQLVNSNANDRLSDHTNTHQTIHRSINQSNSQPSLANSHHAHSMSLTSFPAYLSPAFQPMQQPKRHASPRQPNNHNQTLNQPITHAFNQSVHQSSNQSSSQFHAPASQPRVQDANKELFVTDRYASCSSRDGEEYRRKWRSSNQSGNQSIAQSKARTTSVTILGCLNATVVPPDAFERQASDHSPVLCWTDINTIPINPTVHQSINQAINQTIGQRLQAQYERWQPKAKYRVCMDPALSDIKKALQSARKPRMSANNQPISQVNDRHLIHYNGFGVPRPTSAGEIWCFNRSFTQYIPLSITQLIEWATHRPSDPSNNPATNQPINQSNEPPAPLAMVIDCNNAGHVVDAVQKYLQSLSQPVPQSNNQTIHQSSSILASISQPSQPLNQVIPDIIVLAACTSTQSLPTPNPPMNQSDLFTSCLTTPLNVALRFFLAHSPLMAMDPACLDLIPGTVADRKSPLGELNWIFTSLIDSIAFSLIDRVLFARLFRADLLVASLFRHFLLADRVFRSYGVTPVSLPALPSTSQHHLWAAWDGVAESYLLQLDQYLKHGTKFVTQPFFSDQLTAFEAMLDATPVCVGNQSTSQSINQTSKAFVLPPLQLPIVLQVLLAPNLRRRALILLAKFLSKGPSCVQQALDVGITPYILKLFESPAQEIREVLSLIWARIVCIDHQQRIDLIKAGGHKYFIDGLVSKQTGSERQRLMLLFVISICAQQSRVAQSTIWESSRAQLVPILVTLINQDQLPQLRRWAMLCVAKLCVNHPAAQHTFLPLLNIKLAMLAFDTNPDIRSATIYLIACLIDPKCFNADMAMARSDSFSSTASPSLAHHPESTATPSLTPPASPYLDSEPQTHSGISLSLCHSLLGMVHDGSGAVREELAITLATLIDSQIEGFRSVSNASEQQAAAQPRRDDNLPPLQLTQTLTPQFTSAQPNRSPSPLMSPASANHLPGAHVKRGLFNGPASTTALASIRQSLATSASASASPPTLPLTHPINHAATVTLPLSRAFSEPAGIINVNGRAGASPSSGSPSALTLAQGESNSSLNSLGDVPPSPAGRTTTSSSIAPFATPTRSRNSLDGGEPHSPYERRAAIWRCMKRLCQDPVPSVATAAAVITRKVTVTQTDREVFANLQAKRESPQMQPHAHSDKSSHQQHATHSQSNPSIAQSLHQSQDRHAHPIAVGDGILIEHAPTSASYHSENEPLTAESKEDDSGRRPHVSMNPLRRIASAASNMHHAINLFAESHSTHGHAAAHSAHSSPVQSGLSSANSSPLVTGHHQAQPLPSMLLLLTTPLTSTVYDRAIDQLMLPNLEQHTGPDALATLNQLVQQQHRHRLHARAHLHDPQVQHQSMETAGSIASMADGITQMLFHPFEPMLAVCDSKHSVLIFDIERKERVSLFSNDNRAGSKISATSWINPLQVSLLAVGDDTGTVRIWRGPHERKPELVNAFVGLRSLNRSAKSSPLFVMDWIQRHAWLACAGSSDVVSIWDLEREINLVDLPLEDRLNSPTSSITSIASHDAEPIIFAGGSDGSLRFFDMRAPTQASSHVLTKQSAPIVKIGCTRSVGEGAGELVCASRDGDVIRIDARFIVGRRDNDRSDVVDDPMQPPISRHSAFISNQASLASFAIHPQCGLFASSSTARALRVYNQHGIAVINILPQRSRAGQSFSGSSSPAARDRGSDRRGAGSSNPSSRSLMAAPDVLVFHPREPMIAAAGQHGGEIALYAAPPLAQTYPSPHHGKPPTGLFSSSFIY